MGTLLSQWSREVDQKLVQHDTNVGTELQKASQRFGKVELEQAILRKRVGELGRRLGIEENR